jgi:hypothetical protein
VDLSELNPDVYDKDDNRFDFLYKANAVFSPNQLSRTRYIREKEKDYQKLFDQGKKVCFVWGMDKPRITQVNGKYAMLFVDILDNCVNPETQRLDRAWENDEFFYWSPDSCDLLCKQGHIVKNYLRNVPQHDIDAGWLTTNSNVLGGTKINGQMYYLTNNGLHRLIYPDWDSNTYSSGKHEFLLMWSPRDDWFLKDEHSEHRKIYTNGLEKLKELYIQPLFDRMAEMKVNQDEIGLLLYAKSAPGRNAYIQSINAKFRELGEGGSGMTDAESAAIIERYKETMGDKFAEFEMLVMQGN